MTSAKAQGLAEQLGGALPAGPGIEVLSGRRAPHWKLYLEAQGLVNATPVGMSRASGYAVERVGAERWVLQWACGLPDVIYLPQQTQLVRQRRVPAARRCGRAAMAVGQAVDTFRLFTGLEPDAERMAAHFEALIAAQQGV